MHAEIAVFVLNLSDIIFLRTAPHTPVLYFSTVRKSLCFRVEATPFCGGCVACARWCSPDVARLGHAFSTCFESDGGKRRTASWKRRIVLCYNAAWVAITGPCTSTRELTGRQQCAFVTLLWVYKEGCFAFISPCSVLDCFTISVYLIDDCCFCLASEYQLSYMKQYTCIHSDKNLAIFCMPPIYFSVALKGCNSLRGCFRHLGTNLSWTRISSSSPA